MSVTCHLLLGNDKCDMCKHSQPGATQACKTGQYDKCCDVSALFDRDKVPETSRNDAQSFAHQRRVMTAISCIKSLVGLTECDLSSTCSLLLCVPVLLDVLKAAAVT